MRSVILLVALASAGCDCASDRKGATDAGMPRDAGFDGAIPDASAFDAPAGDAGPSDAARLDAGHGDAAASDAGAVDAGSPDAGRADAGPQDAGTPMRFDHVLFVSSLAQSSNLGGLDGADAICQSLATAAALPGRWRAVLSDTATSARARLVVAGPVRDTAGTLLAMDAAELWSGGLRARVDHDERGRAVGTVIVWSGTDPDGERDRDSTGTCGNWTGTPTGVEAGRTDARDTRWIAIYGIGSPPSHACTNTSHLYCLSQP